MEVVKNAEQNCFFVMEHNKWWCIHTCMHVRKLHLQFASPTMFFLYNYTYGVTYNNSDHCRDLLEYLVKLATPRLE